MKWKELAPIVLRLGLSAVFIWLGLNQVFNPSAWVEWVPNWAYSFSDNPIQLVVTNGTINLTLGSLLAIGVYVRKVSFFLSLHILISIVSFGYSDIAVKDFGLLIATISVFLHGADKLCYFKRG